MSRWSNKPDSFTPLSLDVLQRAHQQLTTCALCGLSLKGEPKVVECHVPGVANTFCCGWPVGPRRVRAGDDVTWRQRAACVGWSLLWQSLLFFGYTVFHAAYVLSELVE